MTHLWGAFFIVSGGSLAMFFRDVSLMWLIGTIGIIGSGVLANAYFIKRDELINTVNELRRD